MSWGEFEAKSMVKTSKNNPSVIMWSIGNEVLEGIGGNTSDYTILQKILSLGLKKKIQLDLLQLVITRVRGGIVKLTLFQK